MRHLSAGCRKGMVGSFLPIQESNKLETFLLALPMPRLRHFPHINALKPASCRPFRRFNGLALFARFSSTNPRATSNSLPPRWLSELKARIGKCLSFGLRPAQIDEAGRVLRVVARDWRELLAASEGFLVGRGRAGLEGQEVVWGEMVGFPGRYPSSVRSLG